MLISLVILLLYVCYALYQPNRAVLACFPISMLFTTLPLFSFGMTFVGLDFALYLIAIFIVVASSSGLSQMYCPFRKALLAFVGGFMVVFFLGAYRSSVYPLVVKIVFYLFPLFLWKRLRTANDIKIILRLLVFVSVGIGLYTILECVVGRNFWMEWLQNQTAASIYVDHHDDIRFGFGRCNSFFHFPIPLGDYCALILIFFLFWQMNAKMKMIWRGGKFLMFCSLMFVSLLLSNSRASIVALLIGALHINIFKNRKTFWMLVICLCAVCLFGGSYILRSLESMTGGWNENVGGSSMSMREVQLAYCLNEFYQNPLFGAGFNRLMELQDESNRELMGAESQAFFLLVEQGLCGIVVYLYGCVSMVRVFWKGNGRRYFKFALCLALAWVAADMISLTTGLTITFPIILLMIVYRSIQLKIL